MIRLGLNVIAMYYTIIFVILLNYLVSLICVSLL